MKWIPFTFYECDGAHFLIHAKRKRNGIIVFKTTRATRILHVLSMPHVRLDVEKQWDKVISGGDK